MQTLMPAAEELAALLKQRRETVAVVESSAGGLIAAALLAQAGASAYFLGGAVVYTKQARSALMGITDAEMKGLRSSSEPYAQLLAKTAAMRHGAHWGLAETGAAGPSGNSYGDAAGHSCIAVYGPVLRVTTLETGEDNRQMNMRLFALRALDALTLAIRAAAPPAKV